MSTDSNPRNGEIQDEEPIPKLPRAPLIGKLSTPALMRIGMFGTLFYAVIVMRKPCAEGAGRFVMSFDENSQVDAGPSKTERFPGFELMTAEEAPKRFPDAPTFDAGLRDGGSAEKAGDGQSSGAKGPTTPAPKPTKDL